MLQVGYADVTEKVVLNSGSPWPVYDDIKLLETCRSLAASIVVSGFLP
jgi:hypothetical protein